MKHRSTKTYGHELGLSACFRQWRAESHCRLLHGYALSVSFEFAADTLDKNGWVMDFGALKPVKEWLQKAFDHKLLVALDDPQLDELAMLHVQKLADVVVLPEGVGCEAFAKLIYDQAQKMVQRITKGRVRITRVEVKEHGANSAIYTEE